MKNWIKMIPVILAGSLFLGGCSVDSKIQVVVPKEKKERNLIAAESEGNLSEQVQAPERYQFDSTANGIHILANAKVMVPDVEGIRLKKVRSRNFDEADMEILSEALFKGAEIFVEGLPETESSAEKKEAEEKAAEEMVETEPAGDWEGTETQSSMTDAPMEEQVLMDHYIEIEQLIKEMLRGERNFAGYEIEEIGSWCREAGWMTEDMDLRHRLWTLSALCVEWTWMEANWQNVEASDLVKNPSAYKLCFMPQGVGTFVLENVANGMGWIGAKFSRALVEIQDMDIGTVREMYGMEDTGDSGSLLSDEEIRKASDELMQQLGGGNLELADIKEQSLLYYYPEDNSYSNYEAGVCFVYNRVIDGVSMNYTGQSDSYAISEDGDLVQWPSEQIGAVYGEDGLVGFQWSSPVEIEEWQDEYAFLLPFSEIRAIFEEMMFNDYTEKRRDYPGTWTVSVQEVRLGYVQVPDKEAYQTESNIVEEDGEAFYTGILVPAWDFIGTVEGEMAEWLGVASGSRISFMTINAMDGSIIEKQK